MTLDPLRLVSTASGTAAVKVGVVREFKDSEGQWWLYYTLGSDLTTYIETYASHGKTLGDPEPTDVVAYHDAKLPAFVPQPTFLRRAIVNRDKGPSAFQALADADGENDYPTAGKDDPVSYRREVDGRVWLVYCRGQHLRDVVRRLWDMGQALGRVEVLCTELDEDNRHIPILYRGKRCYRRLIVPKDQGINPTELGL